MAPEQFTGIDADHRVDVFAWASVVCFAANGVPPFATEEGNPTAVMYKVIHTEPDHGALTGSLRALVARAHAKDPADRPAIRDLVDELVAQRVADTALVRADEGTPTELVEQTWHLPEALERTVPPTEVQAAARAGRAGRPLPAGRVHAAPGRRRCRPRRRRAPRAAGSSAGSTPPWATPGPAPQGYPPPPPPPAAAGVSAAGLRPATAAAEGPVRYRGDHLTEWVVEAPELRDAGHRGGGRLHRVRPALRRLNDGVPITSVNQADLDEAFDTAWAFLPLVVGLVLAYVALRVVRAVGRRKGFTTAGWRGYAAAGLRRRRRDWP